MTPDARRIITSALSRLSQIDADLALLQGASATWGSGTGIGLPVRAARRALETAATELSSLTRRAPSQRPPEPGGAPPEEPLR